MSIHAASFSHDRSQLTPFFTARLPLPPSINHQYIPVPLHDVKRRHHRALVLAPEARAWKERVDLLLPSASTINQAILDHLRQVSQVRGLHIPLEVEITMHLARVWQRDVDGGIKITLDSVFSYLGLNDTLVTDLTVKKRRAESTPGMIIAVRVIVEGGQ